MGERILTGIAMGLWSNWVDTLYQGSRQRGLEPFPVKQDAHPCRTWSTGDDGAIPKCEPMPVSSCTQS